VYLLSCRQRFSNNVGGYAGIYVTFTTFESVEWLWLVTDNKGRGRGYSEYETCSRVSSCWTWREKTASSTQVELREVDVARSSLSSNSSSARVWMRWIQSKSKVSADQHNWVRRGYCICRVSRTILRTVRPVRFKTENSQNEFDKRPFGPLESSPARAEVLVVRYRV